MSTSDSKVVLVTGWAKGGIDYEYCKAFAEHKCRIFGTDISQRMNDIDLSSSDNIDTLELNVSSDESVALAVKTIISKYGCIDVLVNNAGIGSTGPLAELPLDTIRKAWEINTLGQLRLVQQVVPYMASQRSGSIVNISSVVGKVPTQWAGSYCASKAAVHTMSNTLRVELKPFGIDVVLVMSGAVRSNFGSANIERLDGQDWKLYKEFKEAIAERARASQGSKAADGSVFASTTKNNLLGDEGESVVQRPKLSPETLDGEESVTQILLREACDVRHYAMEGNSSSRKMKIVQRNWWSLHVSSDETRVRLPNSCAMDIRVRPTNSCMTDIEVVIVKF